MCIGVLDYFVVILLSQLYYFVVIFRCCEVILLSQLYYFAVVAEYRSLQANITSSKMIYHSRKRIPLASANITPRTARHLPPLHFAVGCATIWV